MEPSRSPLHAVPISVRRNRLGGGGRGLAPSSEARRQAERFRRQVELGRKGLAWRACREAGADGTSLPGCAKLYVPLDAEGATAAPFGFVFRLSRGSDGLGWMLIAFGERHPANPRTRSVYERAHRRLHGRYPQTPP